MNIDKLVFRIAGSLILISLFLTWATLAYQWLLLAAFVGANMIQASYTGFCPMAKILKLIGYKPGNAFE